MTETTGHDRDVAVIQPVSTEPAVSCTGNRGDRPATVHCVAKTHPPSVRPQHMQLAPQGCLACGWDPGLKVPRAGRPAVFHGGHRHPAPWAPLSGKASEKHNSSANYGQGLPTRTRLLLVPQPDSRPPGALSVWVRIHTLPLHSIVCLIQETLGHKGPRTSASQQAEGHLGVHTTRPSSHTVSSRPLLQEHKRTELPRAGT